MTQKPRDHLAPGGRRRAESDVDDVDERRSRDKSGGATGPAPAEPEGTTGSVPADPGAKAGSTDAAARGKATRSPTEVATRPHLEGSEQGPM